MNKSILTLVISFFLIFNYQLNVWSSPVAINYENKDTINANYFLSLDNSINEKPYQVIKKNNIESCNPNTWLYSILFPGLGQIMLGNQRRGITFTFAELGMLALSLSAYSIYNQTGISEYSPTKPRTQANVIIGITASILGAVLLLLLPFLHVWNIIDALSLSREINCGNPGNIEKKDNTDYQKSFLENNDILTFELVKF